MKKPSAVAASVGPSVFACGDVAVVATPSTGDMAIVASSPAPEAASPRLALASHIDGRPAMMPKDKVEPIVYRGCKIYSSVARQAWRVYPYPMEPVYDKRFGWSTGPAPQWQKVMAYCESPALPDCRKKDLAAVLLISSVA